MRLQVYEKELGRLLTDLRDGDFVIFEDSRDTERHVRYLVHESAVLGEVGSRHRMPGSSGMLTTSITALGCLGFEGGGMRRSFSRDRLPHDARRLACLTELLFGAAFGSDVGEMLPLVTTLASRQWEARPTGRGITLQRPCT